MTKRLNRSVPLWLALILVAGATPRSVRGSDDGREITARLRSAAAFGPIGRIYSLGAVAIDGRRTYGEQMIWGGEVLQVPDGVSACVTLDSIGRIVLERGAILRLVTTRGQRETGAEILMMFLISGSVRAQLRPNASAYLVTCGTAFTITSGASFYAEIRDDRPVITVSGGAVETDPSYQEVEYIVEPVVADPLTGSPVKRASSTRRVAPSRPGAVQQTPISVAEIKRDKKTKKKIGPAEPGRPIAMALETPGIGELGSQSVTVFTNNFGVATATFTAGPNPGETRITATSESGAKWVGKIIVAKPGFWTTKNKILVSVGIGAAVAFIIFIDKHRSTDPLQQQMPSIP